MTYYRYHMFFCTNQRDDGKPCCQDHDARDMRDYAKARVKALGLNGVNGTRVNTAGCMDRCSEGPVMVIYPEGIWYTYENEGDIDEIIDQHLMKGQPVQRLRI